MTTPKPKSPVDWLFVAVTALLAHALLVDLQLKTVGERLRLLTERSAATGRRLHDLEHPVSDLPPTEAPWWHKRYNDGWQAGRDAALAAVAARRAYIGTEPVEDVSRETPVAHPVKKRRPVTAKIDDLAMATEG